MFATPRPTTEQRQVYTQQAHQLRAAAVAGLFRDIARWVSSAAR